MKFRIESKGRCTHVYNADTGEEINNLSRVEFVHDIDGDPTLRLTSLFRGETVELYRETKPEPEAQGEVR